MIGFNPTPELKDYSHIIMQNNKAIIIEINSKLKSQENSQIVTARHKLSSRYSSYRADNTNAVSKHENLKL